VYIEGMMVYDGDETKGVRLWDGAHSGYTTANFTANQRWQWSLQAPVPDLIFLALGTNDFRANTAAATYGTDVGLIIDRIRTENIPGGADICPNVPIILVHLQEPVDGSYTPTWASYLAQLEAVAAARTDVFVIDVSAYIPGGVSLGIGDTLHPDDNGHAAIANIVSRALLDGYSTFRAT
jgi:lysophospholipase L1-like esterase